MSTDNDKVRDLVRSGGIYFNIPFVGVINGNKVDFPDLHTIENLVCLFPKRVILSSPAEHIVMRKDNLVSSDKSFKGVRYYPLNLLTEELSFMEFKELLHLMVTSKCAYYYIGQPAQYNNQYRRRHYSDPTKTSAYDVDDSFYINQSGRWEMDSTKLFYDTPSLFKTDQLESAVTSLKVALPWLYRARTQDYLELMAKYDLQFMQFQNSIDRLSNAAMDVEQLSRDLIVEMRDSFDDMNIILEKKKYELQTKGIKTAIGSMLTILPFLLPESAKQVDPRIISSVLGATTIQKEAMPLIEDVRDLARLNRENKFYLIWKWSKKYRRLR